MEPTGTVIIRHPGPHTFARPNVESGASGVGGGMEEDLLTPAPILLPFDPFPDPDEKSGKKKKKGWVRRHIVDPVKHMVRNLR